MSSATTPPVVMQPPPPPPPPMYVRRRSWAGPIVLIVIGVIFLLKNLGYGIALFPLFAKYWPLLLIIWGLVKLVEYAQAKRGGYAAPGIGAGGVVLLVFLILIGLAVSGLWQVREHWGPNGPPGLVIDDEEVFFGGFFGQRFQFTEQVEQAFPAGTQLRVRSDRGGIRLLAGSDDKMLITLRKTVVADNQDAANKINETAKPAVTVAGNIVDVRWNTSQNVRMDMDITLPRKALADLSTGRGDLEINGREGDLTLSTDRGDVTVSDVKGNVLIHLRHGDLRTERVVGDVVADGRVDDATANDVSGTVSLSGDFFGDTQVQRAGAFTFHSSRTDLTVGKVEGSLQMSGDALRAVNVAGPFRITTKSKDISVEQVAGDVRIQNANGEVEVRSAKLGNVEVQNRNGAVRLTVPAGASFQLEGSTRDGDVQSDFGELRVDHSGRETRVNGGVGSGGPRVQLQTEHASIEVRKGV